MKAAAFLLLIPAVFSVATAQPLRVYSELAQIDVAGRVIAPAEPREILSPALVRNGFTSFQVVVDVPQGTTYQLYVAQNPENAVQATLYRESGEKLERVEQPVSGNNTQVFWLDLWTARDAPVQRIKVEPQLHVNNDWVIYPMEGRVTEAAIAEGPGIAGSMSPGAVMREYVCAKGTPIDWGGLIVGTSLVNMRFRNAAQDLRLAATAPRADLQKLVGACDAPASADPEWYLRIRDYLFRLR